MITPTSPSGVSTESAAALQVLVRYGAIPQVARYTVHTDLEKKLERRTGVVISTDRGQELGEVLEVVPPGLSEGHGSVGSIDRLATAADRSLQLERQEQVAASFGNWHQRIQDWELELELMDIEQTLDGEKHILYVLSVRGAETTRLALLAAAAGLGIVSVQPVDAEGIVDGTGSGCGSGCGCSH